jgi:hypothetical protein
MIVVNQQMMPPAQENSVSQVRPTSIAMPLIDVMSLRPRGRTITPGEPASAIPNRERDPLSWAEEPLRPTQIQHLTLPVERNVDRPRIAREPVDRVERHWLMGPFPSSKADSIAQVIGRNDDPNRGSHSRHPCGIGIDRDAHELNERVDGHLFDCARIRRRLENGFPCVKVDEPRATTPWTGCGIDRGHEHPAVFWIEKKRADYHSVGARSNLQVAKRPTVGFARRDARGVEFVAKLPCASKQLICIRSHKKEGHGGGLECGLKHPFAGSPEPASDRLGGVG